MTDPAAPGPLLTVQGIRKNYSSGGGTLEVLRGIDFQLEPGGFVAVVGQSGSGKSTLLHIMGLLDAPDEGEVCLDGERIDNLPAIRRDRLRNTAIGMVFQAYHLLPELTALENVLAPLLIRHGVMAWLRTSAAAHEQARLLLDRFGLGERLRHKPRQLSGGEMQRVAIARALVTQPRVLLADEPTGNLDTKTSVEIMELISGFNRDNGITVIMVTHEPDIAAYAKRIIRFVDGHIQSDERRQDI